MRIKRAKSDVLFYMILTIICVLLVMIIVYPLYFITIASFSHPSAVANGDTLFLPKGITFCRV